MAGWAATAPASETAPRPAALAKKVFSFMVWILVLALWSGEAPGEYAPKRGFCAPMKRDPLKTYWNSAGPRSSIGRRAMSVAYGNEAFLKADLPRHVGS